jgi:hypothetical protein
MEYEEWMLNDKEWDAVPRPYEGWNELSYHVISNGPDAKKVSKEQLEFFDFSWAMMMQQETGWN